jgi:hypothetical protein
MKKLTLIFTYTTVAFLLALFGSDARAQTAELANARASIASPSTAENSVPRLVQFNGTVKDGVSRPVSGVVSITFALYAEQDGGAPLWTETQNVLADSGGHYNALLGTATSGGFPAELFSASSGGSRWLGVTIAQQAEQPRVLLASVPYALRASDADTLGGLPASSYVTTQQLAARAVSAAPSTTFVNAGGTLGAAPNLATADSGDATGNATGDALGASTQSVTQAAITGTGTANYLPRWTSGSNLGVSKIYQANGGFVGINTSTPLLQLDVNGNSIFRGSFQIAPQGVATASAGQPSHSFQWQASLYDSDKKAAVNEAFGFRTVPYQNNIANPTAKLDLFYGPGGGVLSDTGLSIANDGRITFSPGQQFFGDSAYFTSGLTVLGEASVSSVSTSGEISSFTSQAYSLVGTSSYSVGTGVLGQGTGQFADGVDGNGYVGVYGVGRLYAGEFEGDVFVDGNLIKQGGSFKIDHPLDPENKYLSHSFVESPDMKNVYDGLVTTDAHGFATVTMPGWFESLNRDFRYQLTAVGQFAQAMVSKELANGQFTIQTDKPNVKVSWQITGIRQDAWANAHRIPVEEEKSEAERGHYLRPELFGHPGEASIAAMRPGPDGKLVPIKKTIEAKK